MSRKRASLFFLFALALAGVWFFRPRPSSSVVISLANSLKAVHQVSRLPAALPSPPKVAPPQANLELRIAKAIVQRIKEDSYCKASKLAATPAKELELVKDRNTLVLYQALQLAAGEEMNPCTQALVSRRREDIFYYSSLSQQSSCRVIKALLLTGQWSPQNDVLSEAERVEGKAMLQQLSAEDPDNGYYAFAELGAFREGDPERAEDIYRRFLRTTRFDSPLEQESIHLAELGFASPTAWLYSVELSSQRGVSYFARAPKLAIEFAKQGLFEEELQGWTRRLAARFEEKDEKRISGLATSLLEDAILRAVARASKAELPAILQQKNWIGYFKRRAIPDDISEYVSNEEGGCEQTLTQVRGIHPKFTAEYRRQFSLL